MKKTDLAYIAGLFDGEGCVSFSTSKYKPRGTVSHQILVTLGNTEEYPIQWLHLCYGGSIYVRKPPKQFPRAKTLYVWRLLCQEACNFLKDIEPYLIIKKPQATIAIKYGESLRVGGYKGHPKTEGERAVDEAYKIMISNLNKRGKHDIDVSTK